MATVFRKIAKAAASSLACTTRLYTLVRCAPLGQSEIGCPIAVGAAVSALRDERLRVAMIRCEVQRRSGARARVFRGGKNDRIADCAEGRKVALRAPSAPILGAH